MVMSVYWAQSCAGGEAEVRLASLEEPVLGKEPWETVCWGEKKLMQEELVKMLI